MKIVSYLTIDFFTFNILAFSKNKLILLSIQHIVTFLKTQELIFLLNKFNSNLTLKFRLVYDGDYN